MAVVKLEMSEYELMKENTNLLKESLFREQELADQLAEANAINIKALVANDKNVTIITKVTTEELYSSLRKQSDVKDYLLNHVKAVVSKSIDDLKRGYISHSNSFMTDRHMSDPHMNERYMGNPNQRFNKDDGSHVYYSLSRIIERRLEEDMFRDQDISSLFFAKKRTKITTAPDVITTKGLDQVALEMKNEVYDSLSKKAKKALESNPIILEENHDLRKELKLVSDRLKVSKSIESQRVKDIDRLYKKQEYQQKMYLKFDAIDLIVPEKTPIFGNRKIVKEINEIINREI